MTVFYVAIDGDNGANGSASAPWRTIGRAMQQKLGPGDEVVVKPGTYTEQVWINQFVSADAYLTISSEVPGQSKILPPSGAYSTVNLRATYVVIDGFDVKG